MTKDEDKPVTVAQCERKHRSTWRLLGVLITLLSLLLAVGGSAAYSGITAKQQLDVHEARQEECIKHMNESLQRNADALQRIEDMLRKK